MNMYESLLLFVRASRQGLWKLHLSSLNNLVKYFFAHDQINYARMTPLYLADMHSLQTDDSDSWEYLEKNFAIAKSNIPFTAIGSDHAMEQENKVLKVTGGIKGLTQQASALNRFCLVSPIISSLSEEFCTNQYINNDHRKQHYQLSGSTCSRISSNVNKLLDIMNEFNVSFEPSESVYNLVSKAVLPSQEILQHKQIGSKHYQEFVDERIVGDKSIWLPLKRLNLPTFKSFKKSIQKKVGDKVIQLKEEKTLLSRFLITARKRPELDLESCIGNFEFSVVPKSLFSSDGVPLSCLDKSKLLHHIEDLAKENVSIQEDVLVDTNKVIIIDGMAVVNQVQKTNEIITCQVKDFPFLKNI